MLDWRQALSLENGRLRLRVTDKILNGQFPNLRVGMGDEAHELLRIS